MQVIQLRGDTAANWTSVNPILAEREFAFETDTMRYKIGDGITPWNSLNYREITGSFTTPIIMSAVDNPSTPSSNTLAFYAHSVAGRVIPKFIGPSGLDNLVQTEIAGNGIALASPGNSTTLSYSGMGGFTAVGTVAHPNFSTGVNLRSHMRRATVTSAATANSVSELRYAVPMCYAGEVFGNTIAGGYYFKTRFAISSTVANQRVAVGLWGATGATSTTQVPSALTNAIFVGWDATDANLQLMYNDSTGNCSKIDLLGGYPANNPAAVYELALFCKPNGDEVGYRVQRLDTSNTVSGVLSNNLPSKTTTLSYHAYINNGPVAAPVVLEFMRMYLETDF